MSNNRLWIEDTETGARFLLAKGWGDGWEVFGSTDDLQAWFEGRNPYGEDDIPRDMSSAIAMKPTALRLVTEVDERDEQPTKTGALKW